MREKRYVKYLEYVIRKKNETYFKQKLEHTIFDRVLN